MGTFGIELFDQRGWLMPDIGDDCPDEWTVGDTCKWLVDASRTNIPEAHLGLILHDQPLKLD